MQWSRGEYPRANNHEDDLALIAAHAPYRADDHTDSCPGATALAAAPAAVAAGVIGSAADADTFAFFAAAPGPVVVAVAVAAGAAGTADLDVQATVLDWLCRPVVVFNPPGQLAVPPSVYLAPAAGTYYVQVGRRFFSQPATGLNPPAVVALLFFGPAYRRCLRSQSIHLLSSL